VQGTRDAGYTFRMEAVVLVTDVKRVETRSGKTRWVLTDDAGKEYTTFRPRIGEEAERHSGRRARIQFHEEDRDGFHNVYLDAIEDAGHEADAPGGDSDADEVAWSTAVEAAPWLLGTTEPKKEIAPEELYEKLEPFKRRVAEDIREGGEATEG
jgi:hypothetical protein